jgi:nucleotide-binding universal stress UspA family protein
MSYATLMAYVDAESAPEQRVRLAARLADKFDATLIGLSAIAVRPPFVAEGVIIEETTEADVRRMSARLDEKGKWFCAIAAADRQKVEWRTRIGFPTETLAGEARGADLVIVGRSKGAGDVYSALDPGGAILKVGRPTLVVPDGVSALRAEHVVVGWKDTREARRAVRDALPILRQANSVSIVEVCEPSEIETSSVHVDDVVRYLARHRIDSRASAIELQEGTVAARLIRYVQDQGADLIVTGAYGHSRLGEWMFGGVTHDLFADCPVCCLMAH